MNVIRLKCPKFRTGLVVASWLLFGAYVLTMPWLSVWANDRWFAFDAYYRSVPVKNETKTDDFWRGFAAVFYSQGYNERNPTGMCTLPAFLIHCVDGQNFTELALKSRGAAVGCGCGQGVLGEGLCPIDQGMGYTLSTYISTAPGTGAMAALSTVPIMYTWWYIEVVRVCYMPSVPLRRFHWITMAVFQAFYGLFLICSDCVFPIVHQKATIIWIIAFVIQALTTAYMSGLRDAIGKIVIVHATLSILAASLIVAGTEVLFGMYNFWLGEALSLTIMFGVAPMILLLVDIDVNPCNKLERARTHRLKTLLDPKHVRVEDEGDAEDDAEDVDDEEDNDDEIESDRDFNQA